MHRSTAWLALPLVLAAASNARAVGEEKEGFPKWAERVELEWTNRARVDPALEMTKCGTTKCGEGACYKPKGPLYWNDALARAARFHSVHLKKNGYFAHDSKCKLVSSLKTTYPTTCNGEAACSCEGGTLTGSTSFSARVAIWGAGASGEIIASPEDPNSAFYLWLYEPSSSPTCAFSIPNGHRWLILTSDSGAVGYGVDGNSTGDFGGGGDKEKIASGSHYPRSGASVEIWANWFDTAGPKSALVNVGGTCKPMTLTRGVETNGAYLYTASGLSGCTRYYFLFKDSTGAQVSYPTTGSLGIGDTACADWDATRPPADATCDCTPSCTGKKCGDDGCGGSCGTCASGETCNAGACVAAPVDAGTPVVDAGKSDSMVTPPVDATVPPLDDAGTPSGGDAGSLPPSGDAGPLALDAPIEGSCGCRTAGGDRDASWLAMIAIATAAWSARVRRARRRAR